MGENSNIEWTDATFNPWIGCAKVHEGCANCYAETMMDKRYGRVKWGVNGTRTRTSEATWKQPLKWNREAIAAGERRRVFCASLADVFEDRPELEAWRRDLFTLIVSTPHLDWLLLTKRPENIRDMWPAGRLPNVWLGTSVSNQVTAEKQIPALLAVADLCRILFLSVEPLLGPIDLRNINGALNSWWTNNNIDSVDAGELGWVIVGGESGQDARPMHPDWARSIRDQCQAAGVPFFFKQFGEYVDFLHCDGWNEMSNRARENQTFVEGTTMIRVGKKKAGRTLDGREWSEFPSASNVNAWDAEKTTVR